MPFIFHGGDYNPDQWDEDMRLFKNYNISEVEEILFYK